MLAYNRFAPQNFTHPEPVGVCDRCGFLYKLNELVEQKAWAGPSVVGLGIRVCVRTCLDELQENGRRTIIIPPDPAPLRNIRPPPAQPVAVSTMVLDDPYTDVLDGTSVLGADTAGPTSGAIGRMSIGKSPVKGTGQDGIGNFSIEGSSIA